MLMMKLGDELLPAFMEVMDFLGKEQYLRVVVEPHVYEQFFSDRPQYDFVYTYTFEDRERCGAGACRWVLRVRTCAHALLASQRHSCGAGRRVAANARRHACFALAGRDATRAHR